MYTSDVHVQLIDTWIIHEAHAENWWSRDWLYISGLRNHSLRIMKWSVWSGRDEIQQSPKDLLIALKCIWNVLDYTLQIWIVVRKKIQYKAMNTTGYMAALDKYILWLLNTLESLFGSRSYMYIYGCCWIVKL